MSSKIHNSFSSKDVLQNRLNLGFFRKHSGNSHFWPEHNGLNSRRPGHAQWCLADEQWAALHLSFLADALAQWAEFKVQSEAQWAELTCPEHAQWAEFTCLEHAQWAEITCPEHAQWAGENPRCPNNAPPVNINSVYNVGK